MTEARQIGKTLVTRKENVAIITFNRPEKMNALTPELFNSIKEVVADVENDDSINAVVITGRGDHFSAGGDVKEDIDPLKHMSFDEHKAYFEPINQLYVDLYNVKKPTIAAINGSALGAGLEIALCCDIRIAADDSQMGEFFVRMGLVPETGTCLLPKIVGPSIAKLICLTGDVYKAEKALEIGLVDQIVPRESFLPSAEKLAARLAKGPSSIRLIKEAINKLGNTSLEESIPHAVEYQFAATRTRDHKEAIDAYLEKRAPDFKGGKDIV